MEYKKLGRTELIISQIGFGCWAIGGHGYGVVDDQESALAVRMALDMGINFFDTANVYGFGHSEEVLGRALGPEKKNVLIATKFGVNWDENSKTFRNCSPKQILKSLDGSLSRLKIECIPLYQLHWYDNLTPFEDIMETLKECQNQGKIRYIGVSNLSAALSSRLNALCRVESNQLPYGLLDRSFEADIEECARYLEQGIVAYNVLARGLLSGKYGIDSHSCHKDTRKTDQNFTGARLRENLLLVNQLKAIGEPYDKKPAQVAIRWVLDNPNITSAIIGMKTVSQVVENVSAVGWTLSAEERRLLEAN